MKQKTAPAQSELLTFAALLTLLGRKSRQTVYDLMRRDPSFPRPIQMGSEFSIAWHRSEVRQWIDAQARQSLDGVSAVERRQLSKRQTVATQQ